MNLSDLENFAHIGYVDGVQYIRKGQLIEMWLKIINISALR